LDQTERRNGIGLDTHWENWFVKYAMEWTSWGHRKRGWPRNTWRRDSASEM